jgi:hypothetical protein
MTTQCLLKYVATMSAATMIAMATVRGLPSYSSYAPAFSPPFQYRSTLPTFKRSLELCEELGIRHGRIFARFACTCSSM